MKSLLTETKLFSILGRLSRSEPIFGRVRSGQQMAWIPWVGLSRVRILVGRVGPGHGDNGLGKVGQAWTGPAGYREIPGGPLLLWASFAARWAAFVVIDSTTTKKGE